MSLVASTPATPVPFTNNGTGTPGTWRHPRLDEITRRQHATLFTTDNVRTIVVNGVLLLASCRSPPGFLASIFSFLATSIHSIPPSSLSYPAYILAAIRVVLVANITLALSPLLRRWMKREDEITDIPLTPSQRKLLGLNPTPSSSAPPTPGSSYITPPRYTSRSTSGSLAGTPRSDNSRRAVAGTPPRSSGSRRASFGSPFASPYATNGSPRDRDSPLLHKAITGSGGRGSGGTVRRSSYGSNQSPLGLGRPGSDSVMALGLGDSGVFNASTTIPGTPSPVGGSGGAKGGPSVTLNSKWLYEKGRSSLGGRPMW